MPAYEGGRASLADSPAFLISLKENESLRPAWAQTRMSINSALADIHTNTIFLEGSGER